VKLASKSSQIFYFYFFLEEMSSPFQDREVNGSVTILHILKNKTNKIFEKMAKKT
jgi:hypothetical protein